MAEAKLGHRTSKATRRRMALAHLGREHSPVGAGQGCRRGSTASWGRLLAAPVPPVPTAHPQLPFPADAGLSGAAQETVELLSQMAAGQPKSEEHREHISAGQRRRHAAARVLRAVEAVYAAQDTAPAAAPAVPITAQVSVAAASTAPRPAGEQTAAAEPSSSSSLQPHVAGGNGAARGGATPAASLSVAYRMAVAKLPGGATGSLGSGGGGAGGAGAKKRKLSKAQILAEYKAELREYRALQEELQPWSSAFQEKHGRKPGMQDVAGTGGWGAGAAARERRCWQAALCWGAWRVELARCG